MRFSAHFRRDSLRFFKEILHAGVRPPRTAVLVDRNDPDWMHTCLRVIEWGTAHWGGWYSLIIPTDGKGIAEPFWPLLKAFDPDYIYTYQKSKLDLLIADQAAYDLELQEKLAVFVSQHTGDDHHHYETRLRETFPQQPTQPQLTIDLGLKVKLSTELNPFGRRLPRDPRNTRSTIVRRTLAYSYHGALQLRCKRWRRGQAICFHRL